MYYYAVVLFSENECSNDTSYLIISVIGSEHEEMEEEKPAEDSEEETEEETEENQEFNLNFTSDINSGCAPLLVQFSDASSGHIRDYSCSFESGYPDRSSEQNPLVTYEVAGLYPVKLTLRNEHGAFASFTYTNFVRVVEEDSSKFRTQTNHRRKKP